MRTDAKRRGPPLTAYRATDFSIGHPILSRRFASRSEEWLPGLRLVTLEPFNEASSMRTKTTSTAAVSGKRRLSRRRRPRSPSPRTGILIVSALIAIFIGWRIFAALGDLVFSMGLACAAFVTIVGPMAAFTDRNVR